MLRRSLAESRHMGGYFFRCQEVSMLDMKKISFSEIFWGSLALLGVLLATGILALGMRLSIGKW